MKFVYTVCFLGLVLLTYFYEGSKEVGFLLFGAIAGAIITSRIFSEWYITKKLEKKGIKNEKRKSY